MAGCDYVLVRLPLLADRQLALVCGEVCRNPLGAAAAPLSWCPLLMVGDWLRGKGVKSTTPPLLGVACTPWMVASCHHHHTFASFCGTCNLHQLQQGGVGELMALAMHSWPRSSQQDWGRSACSSWGLACSLAHGHHHPLMSRLAGGREVR